MWRAIVAIVVVIFVLWLFNSLCANPTKTATPQVAPPANRGAANANPGAQLGATTYQGPGPGGTV
jgi:hypothetical protein